MLNEWDPKRGRGGRPFKRLQKLLFVEGGICHLCGEPVIFGLRRSHPMGPSVDHLTPLSQGGHPTAPENAALAHHGCNSRRGAGKVAPDRPRSRDY